jgi:ABC-2 type transport system ATP-binding protein
LQCDLSRKIKTLSRGNRQKVGLIAALMHKPDLLVLDEPTSGLDPLIQAEFNQIIHEHKRAGRTAFISSHVLSEVQQICDQVAFVREGRLIAQTTVHEITKLSPKHIAVTIKSKILVDFTKLKGVKNVERIGDVISFTYNGNPGQLIKFLSGQPMRDLTISDAYLESVFMEYYEVKNA